MSNESQQDALTQLTTQRPLESSPAGRWAQYASSGYLLGPSIAAGGMGTVHLGLKQGALGFRRLLAIKRLHGHLARDPEFVARFKDEIRLVSRLDHPNIVQTFDVVEIENELALVMEYVDGVTLYQLLKDADTAGERLPIEVIAGVISQSLHGLHSAHELCDAGGKPLHLVHRDVSPQNIMVAKDGLAKVLDFGVAKAASETHVTRTGQLSGKAAYMSPEQALGHPVDRRTDVFAAGIVLWEALTGQRLFRAVGMPETVALRNVTELRVRPPSELRGDVTPALERIVLRALERDPTRRYGSARDLALALEEVVPNATLSAVASGVMVASRQRLLESSQRALSLPPEVNEEARGESARPYVRPSASALQNDVTRPIEGISVEPSPPRRSSRSGMVALALLSVAGTAAVVVNKRAPSSAVSPVIGASAHTVATGNPAPAATEPPTTAVDVAREVAPLTSAVGLALPPHAVETSAAVTKPAPSESAMHPQQPRRKERARTVTKHSLRNVDPNTTTPKPKPNCSPPTYTDPDGIRHFKPECL